MLRERDHLLFQLRVLEVGVDLQEGLLRSFGIQNGRDAPAGRLPEEHDLVDRPADATILNHVPAPVIEPRHRPAQLAPAVGDKGLPQKGPYPPVILFVPVAAHG